MTSTLKARHLPRADGAPPRASYPLLSGWAWLLLLFCYFALHTVIRSVLSGSVDLDEAEQVVYSQALLFGYGPAPPLYTWLQIGSFRVFGESVFGLAVLKNALLFSTYVFTFLAGRRATGQHLCGFAAAVSLLFLPQIAWESQRDLTHSVLASCLAVALLHALFSLLQTGKMRWYVLFGSYAGLGLLSKYNFALWLVVMLIAALSLPQLRPAILNGRMLLAMVLTAFIAAPGLFWAIAHPEIALRSASKLGLAATAPWLNTMAKGAGQVTLATVAVAAPLCLVHLTLLCRAPVVEQPPAPQEGQLEAIARANMKLLVRLFLLALCAIIITVAFTRATHFRGRWVQPLLVSTPVLAVSLIRRRLQPTRCKYLAVAGAAVAAVVTLAIPGRIIFGANLGREEPLMRPYSALASRIKQRLPTKALVVADRTLLAGNLRLGLRPLHVVSRETTHLFPSWEGEIVIVWHSNPKDAAKMPIALRDWATSLGVELSPEQPELLKAPYKHSQKKTLSLAVGRAHTTAAIGKTGPAGMPYLPRAEAVEPGGNSPR